MQYVIMVYEDEELFASRTNENKKKHMGAFNAYSSAMQNAGVMLGAAGLLPPETATVVRTSDGRLMVQDGPFSDSKEQLGGIFLIEVPDLDAALEWAAKCPTASGMGVEVRPLLGSEIVRGASSEHQSDD